MRNLLKSRLTLLLVFVALGMGLSRPVWADGDEGNSRGGTRTVAGRVLSRGKEMLFGTRRRFCGTAIAAAAVVLGATAWYLVSYNTPLPEGPFRNAGTQEAPIPQPDIGPDFQVEQRGNLRSVASREGRWVQNSENSWGRVVWREGRLNFLKWDGTLIARTSVFSPFGRPYNENTPVRLEIENTEGEKIGEIVERSLALEDKSDDPSDFGVHRITFSVYDNAGSLLGRSESFEEHDDGTPVGDSWEMIVKNHDGQLLGQVTRSGGLKTYQWISSGELVESPDPNWSSLRALMMAYQDYVTQHRE